MPPPNALWLLSLLSGVEAIPLHNKGLPPPEWFDAKRPGLVDWALRRSEENGGAIFPLVFCNAAYIPVVAAQWAAMSRIDKDLPSKLNVVCLDLASFNRLVRYDAPRCYANFTDWQQISGLWALRVLILQTLTGTAKLDVLMTDSDAIWLRDPRPALESMLATSDLVAQRGSFPADMRLKWGVDTMCMGFALFSSRPGTQLILKMLERRFSKDALDPDFPRYDDQWAINHVLDDAGIVWDVPSAGENSTQFGHISAFRIEGRDDVVVALLPMDYYYRGKCHGHGYDAETAFVLHCYADKHGGAKLNSLSSAGILFLNRFWDRRLANTTAGGTFSDRVKAASVLPGGKPWLGPALSSR